MEVFWALGYEGATLAGLQKAMGGIAAPSFYAAFGSKEQLFREAVELYSSTLGLPMIQALATGPSARASIEGLLLAAVDAFSKPGKPRGCMLVLAALNGASGAGSVTTFLRRLRARRRKLIEQRLKRAVDQGELPSGLDPRALASFYATVLDGLALQARDGASRQSLHFAVRCALAAWDTVVTPPAQGFPPLKSPLPSDEQYSGSRGPSAGLPPTARTAHGFNHDSRSLGSEHVAGNEMTAAFLDDAVAAFGTNPTVSTSALRELQSSDPSGFVLAAVRLLTTAQEKSPGVQFIAGLMFAGNVLIDPLLDHRILHLDAAISLARNLATVEPLLDVRLMRKMLSDAGGDVQAVKPEVALRVLSLADAISDCSRLSSFLMLMMRHYDFEVCSEAALLLNLSNFSLNRIKSQIASDNSRLAGHHH